MSRKYVSSTSWTSEFSFDHYSPGPYCPWLAKIDGWVEEWMGGAKNGWAGGWVGE